MDGFSGRGNVNQPKTEKLMTQMSYPKPNKLLIDEQYILLLSAKPVQLN